MKCSMHGCNERASDRLEVTIGGKSMTVHSCRMHMPVFEQLVRDVREEKELRREQRREKVLWGDPQRAVS